MAATFFNVRVLDFSRDIQVFYTSLLMGDMGAEVIKIECLHGDECRKIGPSVR